MMINLILVLSLTISQGRLIPLTDNWRNTILNQFNMYRRRIATGNFNGRNGNQLPAANNMNALKWDNDLEQSLVASINKKQCESAQFGAQLGGCVRFGGIGDSDEQIFNNLVISDTNLNAINQWFDEGKYYEYGSPSQCCKPLNEQQKQMFIQFGMPIPPECKNARDNSDCLSFYGASNAGIDSIGCAIQDCRTEKVDPNEPMSINYQLVCHLKKGDTTQIDFNPQYIQATAADKTKGYCTNCASDKQCDNNGLCVDKNTQIDTTPIKTNGLTAGQKQYILDQHNFYRGKVAKGEVKGANGQYLPKAAKMSRVVWDNSLAEEAQKWADGCSRDHDKNVWESLLNGFYWSSMYSGVKMWFKEILIYNYGDEYVSSGPKTNGHLLSIIRQDVTAIGCGYNFCFATPWINYKHWLVCRYKLVGDDKITSTTPYITETEKTGSQCTNGVNTNGLCN